jgi:hypothetical protein
LLPKKRRGTPPLPPEGGTLSEESDRPTPRGSTGASLLGEARGESSRRIWSSVTRTLTVVPLPEGGGGPCKLTGDLRRGPVHPARRDLEDASGLDEPKLGGISEETGCGGGYASTEVEHVWH